MTTIPPRKVGDKDYPYHKRYQQDMIADAIGVDLRAYGALTMLRDIMFVQRGCIRDDTRVISRALGCDPRGWPAIRTALIEAGKIYEQNGTLRSPYVDKVRESQRHDRQKKEMAGHISAAVQHKRSMNAASHQQGCKENPSKPLKSQDADSTGVQQYYSQIPDIREEKEEKNAPPTSSSGLDGHSSSVVAKEEGLSDEGRAAPERKLEASPYLAQLIQNQQRKSRH
jgi:hypothetical protein